MPAQADTAVGARVVKVGRGRRRSTLQPVTAAEIRQLIRLKVSDLNDGADHFQILGLSRNASDAEIRKTYFDLAGKLHPDRLRAAGITELSADSQRVCAAVNSAFGVLGNPKKRTEYVHSLDSGGAEASEAVQDKAVQALSAEEHFRRGEWALRRNHFHDALAQFERAVELNPEEAEHHALVAWTKWCAAEDKEALRGLVMEHLQRALDLAPRNLAALYYRGRIAEMDGKTDTALHYFRQVMAINRSYQDTALQVRLLESRRNDSSDSGGSFFSRLKKPRK